MLWLNRYEIGQAGGVPVRLNRMTGEVIACVPRQGCFSIIPAGEPELGTPHEAQAPLAAGPQAAPAKAAPPAAPAAQKPSPKKP